MRTYLAQNLRNLAAFLKDAGPLTNIKYLRHQAVFLMGPAGAGKSFVVKRKYLKYMPGGGSSGVTDLELLKESDYTEAERSLTNVSFESAVEALRGQGFDIELQDLSHAKIPFRLMTYDQNGGEREIPRDQWKTELPPDVYAEVKMMDNVIFKAPKAELPSYWRQINPDDYKEELAGYREKQPGFVHEMSSQMSKAYFIAAVESGDPLVMDGTGVSAEKMKAQLDFAKKNGYRTSLLYIWVPLTVSLIRNALRDRSVDPNIVAKAWGTIQTNYPSVKSSADKATVINNRNDSKDRHDYAQNADYINNEMRKHTGMTLAEFVLKKRPVEERVLKELGVI